MKRPCQPYGDPYLNGVGIGLVFLAAYVLVGRGLGASGGFSCLVAAGTAVVQGSAKAASMAATKPYLADGISGALSDWLVLMLAGIAMGGFLSSWHAGRWRRVTESGAVAPLQRMVAAICGGILMGIGAKFARGCTSGQALSGGALLSAGSWVFIITCFAAGYAFAPLVRRLWVKRREL
jgi:uncharacterized membrane protein YedE/YeeE